MSEFENDIYRRAYNVLLDAMCAIAVYRNRSHEEWLRDHGIDAAVLASDDYYEYLRRMDCDIAEIAIQDAQRIIAASVPPQD